MIENVIWRKTSRGYQAVEAVIKTLLSEHKQQTHVLAMEGITPPHFYFRKNGNIISVGDWFGPARYWDLYARTYRRRGLLVILDSTGHFSGDQSDATGATPMAGQILRKISDTPKGLQLHRISFCGEPNVAIFLKSDIKPDASLQPGPVERSPERLIDGR